MPLWGWCPWQRSCQLASAFERADVDARAAQGNPVKVGVVVEGRIAAHRSDCGPLQLHEVHEGP